jgi:glycosyltransferase involved in cell wall biosynthesis
MNKRPVVSVIIICYNQAAFLPRAIDSILVQNYTDIEIILVDDGSSDHTDEVARSYENLKHYYQENRGTAAARNLGAKNAVGDFILFLDADDWLLPGAICINVNYLLSNPAIALVSGAHQVYFEDIDEVWLGQRIVESDHYINMLAGNYIGMLATVLFRTSIFNQYTFDESFRVCEDYDLYLKIMRAHPVLHHHNILAVYRRHANNISQDQLRMLRTVLNILDKQGPVLKTETERAAVLDGKKFWINNYSNAAYKSLSLSDQPNRRKQLQLLKEFNPLLYEKYKDKNNFARFKWRQLKSVSKQIVHLFSTKGNISGINWGDFKRLRPFSRQYGYDRGNPVDRYYIENFLRANKEFVKGTVLEVGDSTYGYRFGSIRVHSVEVFHSNPGHPLANYFGSLTDCPQIPANHFDCIILTQTLHLIYDYSAALNTCFRILKPGGVLLLTVPGISQIADDQWGENWFWSFTTQSIKIMLGSYFKEDHVNIQTFGNVFTAAAFLYGLAEQDLQKAQLDYIDPHYQLLITAVAKKNLQNA